MRTSIRFAVAASFVAAAAMPAVATRPVASCTLMHSSSEQSTDEHWTVGADYTPRVGGWGVWSNRAGLIGFALAEDAPVWLNVHGRIGHETDRNSRHAFR
jgi:hypothetical protein